MTNVYSSVKKNYKSAEHLLLCSTKAYLCAAFMNWAGLEKVDGRPTKVKIPPLDSSKDEKKAFIENTMGTFVEEHVLTEFDIDKWQREAIEKRQEVQSAEANTSAEKLTTGNLDKVDYMVYVALGPDISWKE